VGTTTLLLAAVLAVAMQRGVGAPALGEAEAGFGNARSFTLPLLEAGPGGASFDLGQHAHQPVFVYFWASWCAPCRNEAPLIERLWPEYEARGYLFVGVNMLDGADDAREFAREHTLTFPLVRDETGSVYLEYGVYGLPEAFFLRPGLEVQEKYIGELSEPVLRQKLEALGRPLEAS
jgi:cytochrome c biogenesis protein CcmG/thiol:disulfide interchange protein DsbE